MLFNSFGFIFAFVPIVLCAFYLVARGSREHALGWLIIASVIYYASWRPENVLVIAPVIAINFLIAWALLRAANVRRRAAANAILTLGILFNIGFLGYFKYSTFVVNGVNDAFGSEYSLAAVILPLGISFITFQKIAFLVDVHGRRVTSFTAKEYGLFVLFFPQLVAGPIVHFREMMPQFRQISGRFQAQDLAVGVTLFVFGLFKKVILADGIAPHVSAIYDEAPAPGMTTLLPAWLAAVGFTLQIYFDFSGYSDMAIGLARCFGICLPANFDSPLKASSIIDYWLRWHMTLTRFLTAYLYNPLALWLTRRRLDRGRPLLGGRSGVTVGAFAVLLALPTMATMFVSGLWHGAGYTFIVWGLLHGFFLCLNHAWRMIGVPRIRGTVLERAVAVLAWPLTFVAVAFAMLFFRAQDVAIAVELAAGMAGLRGVVLPPELVALMPTLVELPGVEVTPSGHWGSLRDLIVTGAWVASLLAIALIAPNSLRVLEAYHPALGLAVQSSRWRIPALATWRPLPAWGLFVATLGGVAVMRMGAPSEFLYWQF